MIRSAHAAIVVGAVLLAGCVPPYYGGPSWEHERLGSFKVTYYWVADEKDHPGERTETITGLPDTYTAGFKKALATEGTGRLLDGRIVNSAGGGKYAFTKTRWGLGCKGQPLVPFKSIATDPGVIPTGSFIHIAAFAGKRMPHGGVHDGRFVADDVGGSIKGRHIDIFVGQLSVWRKVRATIGAETVDVNLMRLRDLSGDRQPRRTPE